MAKPSRHRQARPRRAERVPSLRRDRAFLSLAAGMALGLVAQIGLIAHLLSALAPLLGAQTAGIAMGLATAAAIAGRTLVGWLMPAGADRRVVACAAYGVQLCGSLVLALAPGQIWAAWLGVLLFGSGIGNATSLPPLIAQTEFSREDALRVVPLITALSQAAYAFAPVLFGLLRAQLEQAGQQPLRFAAAAAAAGGRDRQPGLGPGARGAARNAATDRVTVTRNGRSPADATRGCEVSAQSAAPRHQSRHDRVALFRQALRHALPIGGVRFWLAFHLPSMRAMGISTPTMARICAAMKSAGASATRQGRTRAFSWLSVNASSCARNHAGSSWITGLPHACTATKFQVGTTSALVAYQDGVT